LALLSLLQSGAGWTAAQLTDRLATGMRTVRRDADRLRQLGYAIAARLGPRTTYRLARRVSPCRRGLSAPSAAELSAWITS
jgi:predicted DNA-binding transcriptional regulator YafY